MLAFMDENTCLLSSSTNNYLAFKGSYIFVKQIQHKGVIILELSSESDFVSLNEIFMQLGMSIIKQLSQEQPFITSDLSLGQLITSINGLFREPISLAASRLGEKIKITDYSWIEYPENIQCEVYIHQPVLLPDNSILCGSKVSLIGVPWKKLTGELNKKLAQHILAMQPSAISQENTSPIDCTSLLLQQKYLFNQDITIKQLLTDNHIDEVPSFYFLKEKSNKGTFVNK